MIELIRYVGLFRTLWLSGRYGGGKTALSIYLAVELCRQDNASNICSNTPLIGFGDPIILDRSDILDLHDTVLILDEAWLMLGAGTSNTQVQSWLAYLRKQNVYVLLPSVMPLAKQVSHLVVEREFSFVPLGVPLWLYKWRLSTGQTTKGSSQFGRVFWWKPQTVFSMYDHESRPGEVYYYYASTTPTDADNQEVGQ